MRSCPIRHRNIPIMFLDFSRQLWIKRACPLTLELQYFAYLKSQRELAKC